LTFTKEEVEGTFVVPDGVSVIEGYAFAYLNYPTNIVMSNNVKFVGDGAFANSNIKSLDIGSNVKQLSSGNGTTFSYTVFDNCAMLETIRVNGSANGENGSFKAIDGVLFDKSGAILYKFPANKRVSEYVIPCAVKELYQGSFENNQFIETVETSNEPDSGIETVGQHAFYNCISLSTIYFKNSKAPALSGEAPFLTYPVFDEGVFNPRTVIYYSNGYGSEAWESIGKMYTVAEYSNAVGSDVKDATDYYAVVIQDKAGKPINGITFTISSDGVDKTALTRGGVVVLADTKDEYGIGFDLDYSKPYHITIVDEMGEYFPFENAEFYLDAETRITYITLSSVPTVSGVSVEYDVKDKEQLSSVLTDDAVGTVIGTGHQKFDINSETVKINTFLSDNITITLTCGLEKGTSIDSYQLTQNGADLLPLKVKVINTSILDNGRSVTTVELTVATNILENEQDLYAEVKTTVGLVRSKLNIQVISLDYAKANIDVLMSDIFLGDIAFPDWINDLLRDLDFKKLSINNNKVKFKPCVSIEPDSYKFGIDTTFTLTKKGWDENQGNKLTDNINNWEVYKNYFKEGLSGGWYKNQLDKTLSSDKNSLGPKPINFDETNQFKVTLTIGGYYEKTYKGINSDTSAHVEEEMNLKGLITVKYANGATKPLPIGVLVIPIRLDFEVSGTGKLEAKWKLDQDSEFWRLPDDLDFTFTIKAGVSAGIGFAMASAGVYGNMELAVILGIIPEFDMKKITLSGDVGLYVNYNGLFVKYRKEWSILEWCGLNKDDRTWVIYEKPEEKDDSDESSGGISGGAGAGGGGGDGGSFGARSVAALYDASNYEIATSSFTPVLMALSPNSVEPITEEAYSGMSPRMIQVGDKIYVIYQDDLVRFDEETKVPLYTSYKDTYNYDGYDKYNYQKIVYRVYDTKNDEWLGDVHVLDDKIFEDGEGRADGAFDVYSDGTNAVIVYTQLKNRLTSDNIDDMGNYVGSLEVKTAVLSNGVFVPSEDTLTNDDFYDFNLHVGMLNGKLTAVWLRNELNSMFGYTVDSETGERGVTTIYYSVFEDGQWSTPIDIATSDTVITDLEIGKNSIAYITDANNDLFTAFVDGETVDNCFTDRIIHIIDLTDPEKSTVSPEENAYYDISYMNGRFVCYLNNNLYYVSNEEGMYVFDIDPEAMVLSEALENLTEDYQILEDKDGNVKAILHIVTEEVGEEGAEESCSNIYGIFCNDGKFGRPVKLTDYSGNCYVQSFDAMDYETEMMLSVLISRVTASEPSTEDEGMEESYRFETKTVSYPDGYSVGEITFDYDQITVDSQMKPNPITLLIPITNNGYLPLSATDIHVEIVSGGSVATDKFCDENGEITGEQLLSGESGYLKVTFTPNEVTDKAYKVSVNGTEQDVRLWYSDFNVAGKQVVIGGQYCLVVNVTNNGYLPEKYHLTAEHEGEIVDERDTDTLAFGQSQFFVIPLNDELFNEDTFIVNVGVNADSEYYTTNNTTAINVSITPELTPEEISVTPRQGVVDRSVPSDIRISYGKAYSLKSITIGGVEYNTEDKLFRMDCNDMENAVILSGDYLIANYDNGQLRLLFSFTDSDNKEYSSTALITITETYEITWIIDGRKEITRCEVGKTPKHADPIKEGDEVCIAYTFDDWDKPLVPVTEKAEYSAVFVPGEKRIYTVTWIVDGKETDQEYVYNDTPAYVDENGSTVPVKASDQAYHYTFIGWDKTVEPVTGNATYVANFSKTLREYTVTWRVEKKAATDTEVAEYKDTKVTYTYGSMPSFADDHVDVNHEKDAKYTYIFAGWNQEIDSVSGDITYVAKFTKQLNTYVVSWVIDGVTYSEVYEYGNIPQYVGVVTKNADAQYTYTFYAWDKEIVPVVSDASYVAVFSKVVNCYTVIWDIDGTKTETQWPYGSIPEYGEQIVKEADDDYTYTFAHWDEEIVPVTGDVMYTAVFDRTEIIHDMVELSISGPEEISVGEIITFDISVSKIKDAKGIAGIGIEQLEYSKEALNFISAELKKKPSESWIIDANDNDGFVTIIAVDDKGDSTIYNPDDLIIELTFQVKSSATVGGKANLTITSAEAANGELDSITVNSVGMSYDIAEAKTLQLKVNSEYAIDRENGYLCGVRALTDVISLASEFDNDSKTIQVVDLKGNEAISGNAGTGYRIQLVYGEYVLDELVVIVLGDVNGDGKITSTDYLRVRRHFLKTYELTGYNLFAGDVNADGKITSTDYLRVRRHFLGTFDLYK